MKFKEILDKIRNFIDENTVEKARPSWRFFLLWLFTAIVLIYSLGITLPVAISELTDYFHSKNDFSKIEFQLKNRYKFEDMLCKNKKCKEEKVKPALGELLGFYETQFEYDKVISIYNKHILSNDWEALPLRDNKENENYKKFVVYTKLAILYTKNKQFKEAKEAFDKSINISNKCKECADLEYVLYTALVDYYLKTNKPNSALDFVNKTIYKNNIGIEQKFHYYSALAKIYLAKQEYKKAEEYIKLAFSNLPNYDSAPGGYIVYLTDSLIELNSLKARLYAEQNKLQLAKKHWENVNTLSKETYFIHNFTYICSLYEISKINKQQNSEEFNINYNEILKITKPMIKFKNFNEEEIYAKLEELCS